MWSKRVWKFGRFLKKPGRYDTEENQISRFVNFGAIIYTQAWVQAPLAAESPNCDLQLWKNLEAYELVGLALFSDNVNNNQKKEIIRGMNVQPGKRMVRGRPEMLKSGSSLGDFATRRTAETLSILKIKDSFLQSSPQTWNENLDYLEGKKLIRNLRVVNDTAERGVKLFEEFNKALTKDEDEKQFLLQVVEFNRKQIPTETTKKSLIKIVSSQPSTGP